MKKYTEREMRALLRKYNAENGVTCKGVGPTITAVAVMTEDSFKKHYSEVSRSYAFTNQNKAFIANQCSNSIFTYCLDGTDPGVRLDWYVPSEWKIDYCYLKEEV